MSVLRGTLPTDGFTIVSNAWLRDPTLSAKAKGLLCYIASHREGYGLTFAQMCREMADGEVALRSGLVELEKSGHLVRTRIREESGRLGSFEWLLGEKVQVTPSAAEPRVDEAALGNPATKKTTPKKTTKEDDQEPFSADESAPTAQTILAKFIDWLAMPEQGPVKLSTRVIKIYAKSIKQLLGEGFEDATIRTALARMHGKSLTASPSLLERFVVEVQQRDPHTTPAPKPFNQQADEYKQAKESREDKILRVVQDLLDFAEQRGELLDAHQARKIVVGWADSGQIDLNGLNVSVPSLYSGLDVIEIEAEEVR